MRPIASNWHEQTATLALFVRQYCPSACAQIVSDISTSAGGRLGARAAPRGSCLARLGSPDHAQVPARDCSHASATTAGEGGTSTADRRAVTCMAIMPMRKRSGSGRHRRCRAPLAPSPRWETRIGLAGALHGKLASWGAPTWSRGWWESEHLASRAVREAYRCVRERRRTLRAGEEVMRSVSRGFAVFLAIVTLLGVGTLSVVGSGTAHAASLSTSY